MLSHIVRFVLSFITSFSQAVLFLLASLFRNAIYFIISSFILTNIFEALSYVFLAILYTS